MRIRNDWPGSLCLYLLTAWVALPAVAYVLSSTGKTLGPVLLVVSGPVVALICLVFPWLYWRTRKPRPDGMPSVSRAVTAVGAAIVVGLGLWYVMLPPAEVIVPLLVITPEERARMEAQDAAELVEARKVPTGHALLDAGAATQ